MIFMHAEILFLCKSPSASVFSLICDCSLLMSCPERTKVHLSFANGVEDESRWWCLRSIAWQNYFLRHEHINDKQLNTHAHARTYLLIRLRIQGSDFQEVKRGFHLLSWIQFDRGEFSRRSQRKRDILRNDHVWARKKLPSRESLAAGNKDATSWEPEKKEDGERDAKHKLNRDDRKKENKKFAERNSSLEFCWKNKKG